MDSEQLARYLAGEASAAEQAAIEAWAASDYANQTELTQLRAMFGTKPTTATWNIDIAWTTVARQLDRPRAEIEVIPIRRPFAVRWLAAAAVLLAAGGGAWFYSQSGPAEVAFRTAVGQQQTIDLSDGSRVILAPASTLTVHAGFGRKTRSLSLTGQAWFEVGHDASRPFRVQVGAVSIEDLGTEFEVEAHSSEIRIAVAKGSVAIHATSSTPVQVNAGDVATVVAGGQGTVAHQAPVERLTSWRQGTLAFEDRTLGEVAEELRHWYDVSFVLNGNAGTRRLNATIPTNRLDDALETIGTALDLRHNRNGKTVTFVPKGVP